jgi:hypothetical protein
VEGLGWECVMIYKVPIQKHGKSGVYAWSGLSVRLPASLGRPLRPLDKEISSIFEHI